MLMYIDDNEIILRDFSINNFDVKTFAAKDNKFELLAYIYNTNYNIITKIDVNGDGIYETVTYSEHRKPCIKVIYTDGNILDISFDDLGIEFFGMSNGSYYIDIVKDKDGKYYFHSMCSNGTGKNS